MTTNKIIQKKRPTAWTVAKLAGVSQTTVSFVLNNRQDVGIPDSTRQLVIAAAKQLNYQPNLAARSLVRGKTNAMGLWMAKLSEVVYLKWIEYLQNEVRSHDYELIISERAGVETKSKVYSTAPEWPVDGVFAYGVPEYLEGPLYFPVVVFGPYPVEGLDYVGLSLYKAEFEAVQHLIKNGRKHIVYMHVIVDDLYTDERLEAYLNAMEQAGLPNDQFRVLDGTRETAYNSMTEYLLTHTCPDAFVCLNDDMAIGLLRALKEHGVRVPEDVAIVGCNGLDEMDYHQPRLSTLSMPFKEIAKLSWEFMRNRLEDHTIPRQVAILDAHFVIRESTPSISED